MTHRCHCPELDPVAHVGTGPIACACCGKPLVLTCPGECGTQHIARSIAQAVPKRAPKRPKSERRRCPRCGAEQPKRTGRPTVACEACMTPAERKRLEYHRAQCARRKARRSGRTQRAA